MKFRTFVDKMEPAEYGPDGDLAFNSTVPLTLLSSPHSQHRHQHRHSTNPTATSPSTPRSGFRGVT